MQAFLDFIANNKLVLTAAGTALVDLVFALVPTWKSNGVLHFILMTLGLVKKDA